jgi:DNA-directed RNA polymerase alpha subunit
MSPKEAAGALKSLVERNNRLEEENRKLRLDNESMNRRLRQIELLANRTTPISKAPHEIFSRLIASLDLSVRASNYLESARIGTIGELVKWPLEGDGSDNYRLSPLRSLGEASFKEVIRKLASLGLRLGMTEGDIAAWTPPQ